MIGAFRLGVSCVLLVSTISLQAQVRVSRTVHLMGTTVTLETFADSRPDGLEQLERLLKTLEATESELSSWRPNSIISMLNRQSVGTPFPLEPHLCELFGQLTDWHQRTQRAFDPAIGTLMDTWANGLGAAALETARNRSGMRKLRIDRRDSGCAITRLDEVRIDAGGFGKGEGLDRVMRLNATDSAANWMINLGGQIMVRGRPPSGGAWNVALAHPVQRGQVALMLGLEYGSLATSGGSENDILTNGGRVGHILDPRSGETIVTDHSVTVWHPAALTADILSTALYVMGPDAGLAWAEQNGVMACFLIPARGRVEVRATPLFAQTFLEDSG